MSSTPYNPFSITSAGQFKAVLYDRKGRTMTTPSSNVSVITDLDGNTITRTATTLSTGSVVNAWTDTINRAITEPDPLSSTNVSNCPSSPTGQQGPTSSATWYVPGYTSPFLFCYTWVYFNTNFWGNDGESTEVCNPDDCRYNESWNEVNDRSLVLQSVTFPDHRVYKFAYDSAASSSDKTIAYATIKRVILPTGGSLSYCYSLENTPQLASVIDAKYPSEHTVGAPLPFVVKRIESETDVSADCGSGTTGWTYKPYTEPGGSSSSSYSVTETDPLGNDTVHTFDYNTSRILSYKWEGTKNEASRDYYAGSSSSGSLLMHVANSYIKENLPDSGYSSSGEYPTQLWIPQEIDTKKDGVLTSSTVNTYANLFTPSIYVCTYHPTTNSSSCAVSVGSQAVSLGIPVSTATGDVTTTTHYTYETNATHLAKNMLAYESSRTISDASSSFTSTLSYDETPYSFGSGLGHITTTKISNSSGSDVSTHTYYGNYGMAYAWVDGNGNTTKKVTSWDSNHLFPEVIKTPSGNTSYSYDSGSGRLLSSTDINNNTTAYSYTDGGKLQTVRYPSITSGFSIYYCYPDPNTSYLYSALSSSVSGISSCGSTVSGASKQEVVLDAFGRKTTQVGGNGAVTFTGYNALGRMLYVSTPYFSSNSTKLYTSYAYDALNRMHYICNADNGTLNTACAPSRSYKSIAYQGNKTTSTDENGNTSSRYYDQLGRLVQVTEPNSAVTVYSYDALNNLRSVTQSGLLDSIARSRSYTYDGLSRLHSASNPEAGTVGYTYDANSNVHTKTDARGVVTTYAYDTVNRLTSKTYSDSTTPISCYQYDAASVANGLGRLANAWTQKAGTTCSASPVAGSYLSLKSILAYDAMGRPTSATQQLCIGTTCSAPTPYSLAMAYDLAGNMTALTNSVGANNSPLIMNTRFDAAARPCLAMSNWSVPNSSGTATAPLNLFQTDPTIGYAAFGGLQNWYLGSTSSTVSTDCSGTPTTPIHATQTFTDRLWVNNLNVTGQVP